MIYLISSDRRRSRQTSHEVDQEFVPAPQLSNITPDDLQIVDRWSSLLGWEVSRCETCSHSPLLHLLDLTADGLLFVEKKMLNFISGTTAFASPELWTAWEGICRTLLKRQRGMKRRRKQTNKECNTSRLTAKCERLLTAVHVCEQTMHAPRSPKGKPDISLKSALQGGTETSFQRG